eukprot:gene7660-8465_t
MFKQASVLLRTIRSSSSSISYRRYSNSRRWFSKTSLLPSTLPRNGHEYSRTTTSAVAVGFWMTLSLLLTMTTSNWVTCEYENSFSEEEESVENRNPRRALPLTRNFVADVVEAISPTVVNIVCMSGNSFLGGASSGSGFIISSAGYIVTNAHVVANCSENDQIIVTMKSGKKRVARLHSIDQQSDLAIIKLNDIEDEILPVAPLGQSSKVRAGEFVVAIGSPMLLQNSASLGIISATARHASELGISNNRSEYLQTDAAVNVGNSGGPLVNLDGEVIGINTLKVAGTDGISLAIPIDVAQQIIKQLLLNKRVIRPYVGLRMAEMVAEPREYSTNRLYRKSHKYPPAIAGDAKVVVVDVQSGSPAQQAGLASGDVIVGVNGRDVRSIRDVFDAIGLEVGRVVDFKVQRAEREFNVTLVTAPETNKRRR